MNAPSTGVSVPVAVGDSRPGTAGRSGPADRAHPGRRGKKALTSAES